jgi:uncharacterized protein YjbI with pentapeptide repeats
MPYNNEHYKVVVSLCNKTTDIGKQYGDEISGAGIMAALKEMEQLWTEARKRHGPFKLEGANLEGGVFIGAKLHGSDLKGANLRNSKWYQIGNSVYDSNCEEADFSGSSFKPFASFSNTNLRNSNFSNTDILGLGVKGSDLSGSNFNGATIRFIAVNKETNFSDADFTNCKCISDPSNLINNRDETMEEFIALLSDTQKSHLGQKSSGCFVATAVYGGPDKTEVVLLRTFRDTVLTKYRYGRLFIKFYEITSPRLVPFLIRNPAISKGLKFIFIQPVVSTIEIFTKTYRGITQGVNK